MVIQISMNFKLFIYSNNWKYNKTLIVHRQDLLQLFCDLLMEFNLILKKNLVGGLDVFRPAPVVCVHLIQKKSS